MGWGQPRNSGISSLETYQIAVEKYEGTKPIRGRELEVRPLGLRRNADAFSIHMDEGVVECRMYRHPQINFYPDGTIRVLKGGYNPTTATAEFIRDVLGRWHGYGATVYDRKLHLQTPVFENRRGQFWFRIPDEGLLLSPSSHTKECFGRPFPLMQPENPTVTYVHTINRIAANKIRKLYADLRNYAVGMYKLNDGKIPTKKSAWDISRTYLKHNDNCWFPRQLDNPDYMKVMYRLITSTDGDIRYDGLVLAEDVYRGHWGDTEAKIKGFTNVIDCVLFMHHKDEVFRNEAVPLGTLRADPNGWAFRGG